MALVTKDNQHLVTKLMTDVFKEDFKTKLFKPPKFLDLWQSEFIKNTDRKWWQFWKPKKVKNKKYDPRPVEFDIVRGKGL